jgi:nitroreductase
MDVMQAVKTRRSIRDYEEKSVPEEKLNKLLEAARLSPSARNSQDRKFIVVRDKEQRLELARAARGQRHVATAPIVIVVAIALDHMTLVAVEEGLGTCWIGGFMQASARDVLNIPDKYMITAMLTVGIPRATPDEKPRKSLQEIICHETFR